MSSTITSPVPGQHPTPLVALVLQSKKALQQGGQLCTTAQLLAGSSAQVAVDVLALDAKVRWMTSAVLEQVKLAAEVAKAIEQRRSALDEQAREWDSQRTQRADALDAALDSLGAQVVPPDFHQAAPDAGLFGPQVSDEEDANDEDEDGALAHSPVTVKGEIMAMAGLGAAARRRAAESSDRRRWKTLRDFVDERGIEDAVDQMENDRAGLEDILAGTAGYPESIHETLNVLQNSLPANKRAPPVLNIIQEVIGLQEATSITMARHLESLAQHYGQMQDALRDSEAGEVYAEEDMQAMTRDVEELPAIIGELEAGVNHIRSSHNRLIEAQIDAQGHLDHHSRTLDDLDDLGEVMTEMLERQTRIEIESENQIIRLHDYLFDLESLQTRFTAYQFSYNKLLLEMGRRRQYQEGTDRIVRTMIAQLDALTEEERLQRERFRVDHGEHLPEDLCLSVDNPPTKWDVVPVPWIPQEGGTVANGDREVLPDIDIDLLVEARDRVANGDASFGAAGSVGSL